MTAYEREMKRIAEKMKNKGYVPNEQRDVETQLEAIANGDAVMTDELMTRAQDLGIDVSQYQSSPTPTSPPVVSTPASAPSAVETQPMTTPASNITYAGNEPQGTVPEVKDEKITYAANETTTPTTTPTVTQEPTASDTTYAANEGEAKPETKPSTTPTGSSRIPSYQEYVDSVNKEKAAASNAIYTVQTAYWDERTKEALAALENQKQAAESYAANERDEKKKAAESLKNSIYESAAAQKEMTYAEAEKDRERANVDASSAYAANRAGYGTNAERMANMGMTASGYSDYEDAMAYAQQRAEIQGANANARQEMRYADYEEREAQRAADTDYAKTVADADLSYAKNMYDISSAYEQDKLTAGQAGAEGKLSAALTYMQSLGNDAAAKDTKKETLMQMAANGQASAELVSTLGKQYGLTDAEIAEITAIADSTAAKADAAASEKANAAKTEQILSLMEMANSGAANAELITAMGKQLGLTDEEIANITGIATNKQTEAETKAEEEQAAYEKEQIDSLGDDYTASDVDYLDIPDEQKQELKQAAYDRVIEQAKASIAQYGGQLGALDDVDALYQNGEIDEATYNTIYKENINALVANAKTVDDLEAAEENIKEYAGQGKITTTEQQKLLDTLYQSFGKSLDKNIYQAKYTKGTSSVGITINGKKYFSVRGVAVGNNLSEILDKIAPKIDNALTMYDGKLYMKCGDKWHKVKDRDGLYDAYEYYYELQNQDSKEKDRTEVDPNKSGMQQK